VGFDAWTVKFDKILGVVSDGRSGLNLLGRLMPVSAFAGRFRLFGQPAQLDVLGPGLDGLASFAVRAV